MYTAFSSPSALVAVTTASESVLWVDTLMPVILLNCGVTTYWVGSATWTEYSVFDGSNPSMALPSTLMPVRYAAFV